MDLAYLTGQRPGDVFGLREIDIRDGALELAQSKTGKKLRIAVTGELAGAVERIMERKKAHKVRSLTLICNEDGQPLTAFALRSRFDGHKERGHSRRCHPCRTLRQGTAEREQQNGDG